MDSEQVLRKLGYIDEVIPDILNESVKDAFNITNTPDWADITRCWVQRKQKTCTCFASNNFIVSIVRVQILYCINQLLQFEKIIKKKFYSLQLHLFY